MNRNRSYLSMLLLITVVLTLSACKGANKATGTSRSTTIKVALGSNAAKSLAPHAAKQAVGTVPEIATITADIYNGSSMIAAGLPLTNNNGVWSAVVSDLPVGVQLTFNGHANNSSAQEIFRGTTLQTLAGPDDEIVIRMEPVQSGTTLPFLQISQIGRPASIAVNGVVPVSVSVVGNAGETLTYQVTAAENGGTFSDASGSITLAGSSATIVLLYTGPETEGTFLHSVQVTDAHGNSVQSSFDTIVVTGILDPTILVQFNPVITALTFTRSGSEVTLTAHVSDTGPANELTYAWSYESSFAWSIVDATANPAVLQGYSDEQSGMLYLTVANGSEGSTTVSYKVDPKQFRESVVTNLPLIPHTVHSTSPGSDCRSGAISGNFIALMLNDTEVGYYDIAGGYWVNTHIAAAGSGGMGEFGIAIDGDILAYVKQDTGTVGWYSISAGAGYDTEIMPDGFGRGDRGVTRIVSNGKIAFVAGGVINIFDTTTGQNTVTSVEVSYGRSLSFRGNIIAFLATNGTMQYYDLATGLTTDTHQTLWLDSYGNVDDIAYPTVDNGTIIFGTSSGYVAYYTIADGRTVQLPFLLADLYRDGAPSISDGIVTVALSEEKLMQDLNGDGQINNDGGALILYDIPTGRMVNTGVMVCCWGDISNGVFVYDTNERGSSIEKDLNNDGSFDCIQTYIVMSDVVRQYFGR